MYPPFLHAVQKYFKKLLPKLVPLQVNVTKFALILFHFVLYYLYTYVTVKPHSRNIIYFWLLKNLLWNHLYDCLIQVISNEFAA